LWLESAEVLCGQRRDVGERDLPELHCLRGALAEAEGALDEARHHLQFALMLCEQSVPNDHVDIRKIRGRMQELTRPES
jgi:hypothetical protein